MRAAADRNLKTARPLGLAVIYSYVVHGNYLCVCARCKKIRLHAMVYHIWNHSRFVLWGFLFKSRDSDQRQSEDSKGRAGLAKRGESDGILGDYLCRDSSSGIVTRLRAGRPDRPWDPRRRE